MFKCNSIKRFLLLAQSNINIGIACYTLSFFLVICIQLNFKYNLPCIHTGYVNRSRMEVYINKRRSLPNVSFVLFDIRESTRSCMKGAFCTYLCYLCQILKFIWESETFSCEKYEKSFSYIFSVNFNFNLFSYSAALISSHKWKYLSFSSCYISSTSCTLFHSTYSQHRPFKTQKYATYPYWYRFQYHRHFALYKINIP